VEAVLPLASLLDILIDFLAEDGWAPEPVPGEPMVRVHARGEHGEWDAFGHVREAEQQVVVYSECPLVAPQPRRAEVMEFVTRANFGLVIGNLELDLDDGELRYKTSLDVKGDRLSPALLRQLVWDNLAATDKYLPGLRAVIESGASAVQALARVESDHSTDNGHHHEFRPN
jgi:hypothetical protein